MALTSLLNGAAFGLGSLTGGLLVRERPSEHIIIWPSATLGLVDGSKCIRSLPFGLLNKLAS